MTNEELIAQARRFDGMAADNRNYTYGLIQRLANALEAATPATATAGVNREALEKWLIDIDATVTREHGFEQVEWVSAPIDIVLDVVAHLTAGTAHPIKSSIESVQSK